MGLTSVPPDQVATIVTTLEMRERPRPRPLPDSPLTLVRWAAPKPDKYRRLFLRVGAPWLWFSRAAMDDATLARTIERNEVEVHAVVDRGGVEVGMLELERSDRETITIAYFGLVPELTGGGHGGWLMVRAMMLAWRPGVSRVCVQTCTLDHPRALGFYRAHGFVAVARTIETFADPRTTGVLPPDAAPHVPCLAPFSGR